MKTIRTIERGCKVLIGFDVEAVSFAEKGEYFLPENIRERISAIIRETIAPKIADIILNEATYGFAEDEANWQKIDNKTPRLYKNLPN